MHICFFIKLLLHFWIYFWHISLIQQCRNVAKNYHLLDVDRKHVTKKKNKQQQLDCPCSPVSFDLFKDLLDISFNRQFVK